MDFAQLISGARPRTLALAVAPVWIGAASACRLIETRAARGASPACAWFAGGASCAPTTARTLTLALLCLGVALFLQIAANYANDYSDGVRGVDAHRGGARGLRVGSDAGMELEERPTYEQLHAPVRLVASGVPPHLVLRAAAVSAAVACLCGLAVVVITGHWWLVLVGALCLLAGWGYVGGRHPYGYAGWAEPAAFLFFGPVATLGTTYAISGSIGPWSAAGGVLAGLIAFAMLSVNNLRDLDADRRAGRRTWAVRMGPTGTTVLVDAAVGIVMLAALGACVALAMANGELPGQSFGWSFCAVLGTVCTLLLGFFACRDVIKREPMFAMRSLSLLALWGAFAYTGFVMLW